MSGYKLPLGELKLPQIWTCGQKEQTYGKENQFSEPKSKTERNISMIFQWENSFTSCFAAKPVSPLGLQFVGLVQKFSDEEPFNAPHGILKPSITWIKICNVATLHTPKTFWKFRPSIKLFKHQYTTGMPK